MSGKGSEFDGGWAGEWPSSTEVLKTCAIVCLNALTFLTSINFVMFIALLVGTIVYNYVCFSTNTNVSIVGL